MRKNNFTIRLSEEQLEWLKKEAERQQRSVGNLIAYIVSKYSRSQSTHQDEFPSSSHQETE